VPFAIVSSRDFVVKNEIVFETVVDFFVCLLFYNKQQREHF